MSEEIKLHISDYIKSECRKRKISLSRLANLSGISRSTLHDWSIPGASIKLDNNGLKNLNRLALFLGISISQVIFGENKEIETDILFESVFKDGSHKYRLKIEKVVG